MRILAILTAVASTMIAAGCVGTAINASTLAVKSQPREELQPRAEAGDPVAQYDLGKSWCCMGVGFDTQTATEWFCKSARQGNPDAMFELGRIYEGDVSRTPAPGQKVMRAIRARKSPVHADLWLTLATQAGHQDAAERRIALEATMNSGDLESAQGLLADWRAVPCEYSVVFPAE